MTQKTRWFVKAIGAFTNEALMDWLAKTGAHQDGIAAQTLLVKKTKENLIEVPSYETIKALITSASISTDYKFQIIFWPVNSSQPKPWSLYLHRKKFRRKRKITTP